MTRRKRGTLIAVGVVAVLAGAEVALDLARSPEAGVTVENLGDEPVDGLVVSFGDSRSEVARVRPGGAVTVRLGGRGEHPLRLTFRQRGNPLGSFELPGFDPAQMNRQGFKLVLRLRPNEVERFQDDAEPATPAARLARDAWAWFQSWLGIEPDVSH